jgi:hypothetical protein
MGAAKSSFENPARTPGSNVKGEVPPLPDDWYGIPIIRTSGLANDES